MNVKMYLRQVRRIDDDVNAKLEQVEALREVATKITTDNSSDRVQTSRDDKMASIVAKIVDLEVELNRRIDKLIDLKAEITNRIERVEDSDLRFILTLRYLNFKTWEKIAVDMNYSFQHVHRLHSKALGEVSRVIEKEVIECDSLNLL